MYFHLPLILLLLANAISSEAKPFLRGSDHIIRGIDSAHRHAVKRSSSFARDLRRALSGVLEERADSDSEKSYHCVSEKSAGVAVNVGGSSGQSTSTSSSTAGSGVGFGSSSVTASGTASASASSASSTAVSTSAWKLQQSYEGQSFFNGWSFYTDADPTDGTVQYVDSSTASSNNLTSITSSGSAIMRVDTTETVSGNRQSVRITTDYTYTGGLVILDAVHVPTGCGTWPAFWSNGPNWPAGGEIDIVEGVNTFTANQASIHTNPGCSLPSSDSDALTISGTVVGGTNCAAAETGDAGCGVVSTSDSSFGSGFNAISGGVYAMEWTDDGIKVWFFERSAIPSDITSGSPDPTGWATPLASWPSTDCTTSDFFYDHSAIFDTTLCGEWAGNAWDNTGSAGQSESCASITGYSTCADFVQNSGSSFADAYWEVNSVKIYQSS
ncbi:glycoside hydrolase family 16 protein [Laetiporus sulphureus 93-53]|uniref:Glycoside hydrolase family 16 protein n=1 Tax=Laetiporus sulphureus 93-53 TaxID=1314785 RepID=A0A165E464_9APHY|nr:glycoside hydrolase family 16 protein [Laetiporus sulphureus 93-53]KZT06212.1 glycoside hydrolase family 16 protein [Laetiporus sulphureus 93-53]